MKYVIHFVFTLRVCGLGKTLLQKQPFYLRALFMLLVLLDVLSHFVDNILVQRLFDLVSLRLCINQ